MKRINKNNSGKKLEFARNYLAGFAKLDYQIEFQCDPDGKIPPELFDYHVHRYWELKFTSDPAVLCIHAPGTVHCATSPDMLVVLTLNYFCLQGFQIEFDNSNAQWNMLPDLMDMLSKLPAKENFEKMKKHLGNAVVDNCRILTDMLCANPGRFQNESLTGRALEYMSKHYYLHDLSVNDVAAFAGVSPQTLNAALRKSTGMSLRRHLIRIRLEEAMKMLGNPRYLIKDVAAMTGWKSQFYFSNSFRKHFGFAPRYREKSSESGTVIVEKSTPAGK